MMPARQISVLIVDKSATLRSVFSSIVRADPGLTLFGTAADPIIAVAKMKNGFPDVILLDLELPNRDGLAFLKKIMTSARCRWSYAPATPRPGHRTR